MGWVNPGGAGRMACQVCGGTGNVGDGDKSERASAMSSDMKGCIIGLVLGGILAFGGWTLGNSMGGQFATSFGKTKAQAEQICGIVGAIGGFLIGFGVSRVGRN